jgi:hypothetical protein
MAEQELKPLTTKQIESFRDQIGLRLDEATIADRLAQDEDATAFMARIKMWRHSYEIAANVLDFVLGVGPAKFKLDHVGREVEFNIDGRETNDAND